MTTHPDHDRVRGADDDAVPAQPPAQPDAQPPAQPDALTGAAPEADEIAAADPDREGAETDPYELRSGIETSPSDDDPGSMLGR